VGEAARAPEVQRLTKIDPPTFARAGLGTVDRPDVAEPLDAGRGRFNKSVRDRRSVIGDAQGSVKDLCARCFEHPGYSWMLHAPLDGDGIEPFHDLIG